MVSHIKQSYKEIVSRVTWLEYPALQKYTVVTALFTLFFSLGLSLIDNVLVFVMEAYRGLL